MSPSSPSPATQRTPPRAEGLCTFPQRAIYTSQLSEGVSRAGSTHRKADLQGDFHRAWAAGYLSLVQGLPGRPLPPLPGRVRWGKPTGGSSCWAPRRGRPYYQLSSLHVLMRPSGPQSASHSAPEPLLTNIYALLT